LSDPFFIHRRISQYFQFDGNTRQIVNPESLTNPTTSNQLRLENPGLGKKKEQYKMRTQTNQRTAWGKKGLRPGNISLFGAAVIGAACFSSLGTAAQRPISDFLSAQGTYCLGTDSNGNPTCGGTSGSCFHYIPPFPNYLDWTDPASGNSVTFDYAGLFNGYLGNPFGTATSGSINEITQSDGSVIDVVTLHTVNAVTWASVGFSGTGEVLFGANEPQVAAGATPSLGSCSLRLVIHGPAPGAPLPDMIALLNGCGDWTFITIGFVGQASGTLADGTPGMVQVTQTGLIRTAGIANPNSRVALDGFPAEHIVIRGTGH
jgi:hypothetical protein